jgi:hypothetical protein
LLRAIRAVLRANAQDTGPNAEAIGAEYAAIQRELAVLDGDRPMLHLARRFGWSSLEVDFVWTAVALAADPRLLVHARALDPNAPMGMSLALYSRIAQLDAASAQAIGRALSVPRTGLLHAAPGAWLPTSTPWSPVPELLHHLLDERDELPDGIAYVRPPDELIFDHDQRASVEELRATLCSDQILVVIHGAHGTGRRTAIAHASGRQVIALELARIDGATREHALVALLREASLHDAIAMIVGLDEVEDVQARVLATRIEHASVPLVLVTQHPGYELRSARPTVRVAWPVPDPGARLALWRDLAGDFDSIDHGALAQRHRIGPGAIQQAVASARAIANKRLVDPLSTAELVAGVRHNIAERMAGLAERVVVKQTWNDCVLPDDVQTQVVALVGRARQAHLVLEQWGYRTKMPRGTGIAAMFSGAPGTGKTMVAGLIANELGLELYQVDLGKVVSKWIGETEKQLGKLFDAAEDGHAVLLFDEADSLFGQRSTEMKGATDRYANLEVNFLLQRIESFHGIVILTTNLDASIDKAFKRRLAAHVVFQPPEEHEREQLWRRMVTSEGAPLAQNIDARGLARQFPKMTGANIRNAALAAAFLAAAERRKLIDHASLVAAARSEYLSMGHVLTSGTL